VGLGPAIVELVVGGSPTPMAWIYFVGPFVGAAGAGYIYKIQHGGE
jgi:glycerol uptake facilitator-like aquaporin